MQVELLHVYHGDKKREYLTDTPENRQKTGEAINHLLKSGIALFLEKGIQTYTINGYDPEKNVLLIEAPFHGGEQIKTKGRLKTKKIMAKPEKKGRKVTGVAPVRGG